jgi:hypothetical protein
VEGPAVPLIHKPTSTENAIPPFVIPSVAEGSAVRLSAFPIPHYKPQHPNRCVIPTGA